MDQNMPTSEAPKPTKAMRLIFEYEGNQVHLVSQQPVEMVVTGFDLSQVMNPGYYVDTRDNNDKTLSRVVANNAFASSAEVFPEHPNEPITRVNVPQQKGAFTVITPIPSKTERVAVVQITPKSLEKSFPTSTATSPASGAPEIKDIASFKISADNQPNKEGGNQ